MQNTKKIIVAGLLGLFAVAPVSLQANQMADEAKKLSFEDVEQTVMKKLIACNDGDLHGTFKQFMQDLQKKLDEFIDLKVKRSPRSILTDIKKLMLQFKKESLETLVHRNASEPDAKIKEERTRLLAIFTILQSDLNTIIEILLHHSGTSGLELFSLAKKLKQWKHRLPSKFNDSKKSVTEWQEIFAHRYGCKD